MNFRSMAIRLLFAIALWCVSGCSGRSSLLNNGLPSNNNGDSQNTGEALCRAGVTSAGSSPMRRLTRFEYNNTVRDLLGDTTEPARDFAPEEQALGFNNNASVLTVSPVLAEQYMTAAEGLAARAAQNLPALLPCDPSDQQGCGRRFIESFGKRAWRRPLQPDEVDRLYAVFNQARTTYDFSTGIQMAMQVMLQSPAFLYRVETGLLPEGGAAYARLTGWEMASRLSYMLWSSMPDDALLAAAEAGQLSTADQIAVQARRMLADPKARQAVANFHQQWLKLDKIDRLEKDATVFPSFQPELRPLLRAETATFIDFVIWDDRGDLQTLLSASYSFRNSALSQFYGEPGPSGDTFQRVELNPARRLGILTHAGILALTSKSNQTSPVQRGKFVREQLLCDQLPPPPPGVAATPPALDPTLTTRQRFAAHSQNPACAGCHQLMDPVGFGLENFDGVGKWRAEENGIAIDASGTVINSDVGAYSGPTDLAQKLATSDKVRACAVTQWFRFGYGRGETDDDRCSMRALKTQFAASGYNIRELLLALTQTDAFLYRKIEGSAP